VNAKHKGRNNAGTISNIIAETEEEDKWNVMKLKKKT
jgi:hypothetical protein